MGKKWAEKFLIWNSQCGSFKNGLEDLLSQTCGSLPFTGAVELLEMSDVSNMI